MADLNFTFGVRWVGLGESPNTGLTVNDLTEALVIMNFAKSRGAFQSNELAAVDKTITQFDTFLKRLTEVA
jgi:hypothetical protein